MIVFQIFIASKSRPLTLASCVYGVHMIAVVLLVYGICQEENRINLFKVCNLQLHSTSQMVPSENQIQVLLVKHFEVRRLWKEKNILVFTAFCLLSVSDMKLLLYDYLKLKC